MQIERYFSDQLSKISWVKRDVKLTGTDGSIIFELKGVEAPDFWSDNAVTIVANKYLKKINGIQETSVKQLVKRVVDKIVEWGVKDNYFSDGKYTEIFRDELTAILLFQYAAFNTPVWMNFGVPGRPQTGSACFLLDIEDNMDSIRNWYALESKIFQAGAGAGVNVSKLRPKNAPLTAGGKASGPISFMKAADAQAGVIKSGGVTRRAAKLIIMDVTHPDIEEFIECKALEEKKARALMEAGYSGGMDGEALTTVSHQNANYSVRVTDDFMNKYLAGDKHATNIINKIAENAWACGDPGLVYADTILKMYSLPNNPIPTTGNPCQPDFATVLTPKGISCFGAVNIGDTIWSGSKWTKISNKQFTGTKPVYEFHTNAGVFIGTEDHHIISEGSRIKVGEAETIDIISGPYSDEIVRWQNDIMDGFVLGDGTVHKASNNLVYAIFGEKDGDALEDLKNLITKDRRASFPSGYEVETTITTEELPKTYLREVPNRFRFADRNKVCNFLRGLFSASGSIVANRITLKQSSKKLICQVQEMLSSVGISSYYSTNKDKVSIFWNGNYVCKESYQLNITKDRSKFAKLIGFIQQYKTDALNKLLESSSSSRSSKSSYEITSKIYLGDLPVYDITVDCDEHTYWTGGLLVSNCLEIVSQQPDSACNLASLNIAKFGNYSYYDWRTFDYVVTIMTMALDVICINSDYPDERIAANSRAQHHIGLGYTNIGSYLMLSGLAYDSNEGRKAVAEISAQLTGQSFLTSALLAEEIGAFPDYEKNKEGMQRVVQEFCNRAQNLKNSHITATWASVKEWGSKSGYRNANTSAIAPTGTIAFLMDADTTGIEPELALIKYKNLAGGGTLKLVNPLVNQALKNLGYDFGTIEAIESHIKDNNSVIGSALKPEHAPIFSTSFGENSLDPMSHVKMVAAAQQFITEGISKTANVPESATVEDIKNIYVEAWKMELKAISIYRDNSKATQPLNITKKPKSNVVALPYKTVRHPLPNERPSITHKIDIANFEGYITCGLYEDGTPGEIFITASKQGSTVSGMLDSIAILISIALQHNVPLYTITNKLINTRFEPSGFTKNPDIPVATSVVDYVCKWLNLKFGEEGKILTHANGKGQVGPDPAFNKVGQKFYDAPLTAVMKAKVFTGDTCTTCGSLLVKSGTCFTCESCGSTSGGCA